MSITLTTRRPKWHPTPPPPPTPKILNLPRRNRRKQPKNAAAKPPISAANHPERRLNCRAKLETLFDQERVFSRDVPIVLLNSSQRRERVVEEREESGGGGGGFGEEKWRFQAEILRAECNFLRMERELALKKLERNRVQMERTLRSAVQTLVSGRKKIYEGKNVSVVLEEEIEDLADKLEELQRSCGVKDFEVRNCSNFDKKASLLQQRLEKLGGLADENCMKEIQGMAEATLSINTSREIDEESFVSGCKSSNKSTDVEILRRKMEGLSKGMLDRMEEEYGSMLSTTTANSSVASSASTSKRIEFPDSSSFSNRQSYQESMSHEEKKCSGYCKALVRRIVEQVRAETEQWSQMQEMLGQLREQMEDLQASKDFWENRALDSDHEIQSLQASVQEWRQKALSFETKANKLQGEISMIMGELEKLRIGSNKELMTTQDLTTISLGKKLEDKRVLICHVKENHHTVDKSCKEEIISEKLRMEQNSDVTAKDLPLVSLGKQLAMEKRALNCPLKENHICGKCSGRRKVHTCGNGLMALTLTPFRDIGNSSPLVRQNSNAILPLCCPEPSNKESF